MKKSSATSCGLQVAVRVRPLNTREKQNPAVFEAIETGDTYLTVKIGESETIYAFDSVFGVNSATMDLFTQVAEPIVQSSMSGVNGTIFAYGQTSSGKTFTMQGNEQEPGILRLAAKKLFAPNDKWAFTIAVSYIEIYNERVKDLLSAPQQSAVGKLSSMFLSAEEPDLKIREDPQKGFFVEGVSEKPVSTYAELMDRFYEGEKKRHVAGTDMNEKSSRSHTIFSISITAKPLSGGGLFKSKLSLVDLAGSESGRSTNAEGERLKEGGQINKSLLTLSMVISSLATAANRSHVKFRDSKLTQILQPSLVGNCMTAVVCCVTPASTFVGETNSTLKFANSAKHLKTEFVVNQIVDANMRSAKGYQDQIDALEQQLHQEREERKQKEQEWQVSVEAEQQRVEQTKLLLDSARTELELTRASHSQQASSASSAMEQLAEHSSRELSAMSARFEQEAAVREARERELCVRNEESARTIATLTGELSDTQARVEQLCKEVREANAASFELKMLVDEHKQDAQLLRSELTLRESEVNETNAALLQEGAKTQQATIVAKQWEARSNEFECALQVQTEQLDYLKQDNAGFKLKCQEQASGLHSVQRECDSLMRDLDSSLQTIGSLECKIKELEAKNSTLDNECATLQRQNGDLEQELKESAKRMEAKLFETNQDGKTRISALQRELDDQSAQLAMSKDNAHELEQQVEISSLLRVALETDLRNAQAQVEEQQRAHVALRSELALANGHVTELQRLLSESGESAKRELEVAQNRIVAVERELEQRDAKINQLDINTGVLQSELVQAKQRVNEISNQLAVANADHAMLLDQYRKLEILMETTKEDYVKANQALHVEFNQVKAAHEQITNMKNQEISQLADRCATLESDLHATNAESQHMSSELQMQVAQLQSALSRSEMSFAQERSALHDELAGSKQVASELATDLQSNVIALQSQVTATEAELEQAKGTAQQLHAALEHEQRQVEQLASSLQHAKQQLETTTAGLSCKVAELETARDQLQHDLLDAQKQCNATGIDLRAAVDNNAALMAQISSLQEKQASNSEELVLVKRAKLNLEHELKGYENQLLLASDEKQTMAIQLAKELETSNRAISELQLSLCGKERELGLLQQAIQTGELDHQALAIEHGHVVQHFENDISMLHQSLQGVSDQLEITIAARNQLQRDLLGAQNQCNAIEIDLCATAENNAALMEQLSTLKKEQTLLLAANCEELVLVKRAKLDLEHELEGALQARKAYEAQLLLASDEKQAMVAQLETSNQAVAKLQQVLHETGDRMRSKEHELSMLQQAVQSVEFDSQAFAFEHTRLNKEISTLHKSFVGSKQVCADLQLRIDDQAMEISSLKSAIGNKHQSVAELNSLLCAEQTKVATLQASENHHYWESWSIELEAQAVALQLEQQFQAHSSAAENEWSARCTSLTMDLAASNHVVEDLSKDLELSKHVFDAQLTTAENQHRTTVAELQFALVDERNMVERLQCELNQAICEHAAICVDRLFVETALESKLANVTFGDRAKLSEVESILESKLTEVDHLTYELSQTEQKLQNKQAELCNEQELMRLAMRECAELRSQLESNQDELQAYQGIDVPALQYRIATLQVLCNAQHIDFEASKLENEICNEAVLEWARVDCDRLVWERTLQMEEDAELRMEKLADEITKLEQDKQEMGMQVESKDMYIKCLQVETDKLRLGYEQRICDLQYVVNVIQHTRECELEEHACSIAKLQSDIKRATAGGNVDEKLFRQCERALAETKQAMETMKRSKDYWISRLQGEINELHLLNAAREEEQRCSAVAVVAPTPRRKYVPITPGRVPLTEREQKRIRLALEEEDDGGVENRRQLFLPAHDEILDNVFASLKIKSSQELDSKLKEMEGELLLLRERTKKLEKAKLTQAQADQINQLKRDYVALKAEHARAKPASEESIAKYEEQCLEAIRTRDEALDKLRRMVEETGEREAAEVESSKFTIQRLERENLMLFKRVRELGGFPTLL